MNIEITQTLFEAAVPAFSSPTDGTFRKMKPFLEAAKASANKLLDGYEPETDELRSRIEHMVCVEAAYRAVPELDLVLTPTGFGVVNNQNQAPASAARVSELTEELRRRSSSARDMLLLGLSKTEWSDTRMAGEVFSRLIWCPSIARSYGICYMGEETFDREYRTLAPILLHAESIVRGIIGAELLHALCEHERRGLDVPEYTYVLKAACRTIAAFVMGDKYDRSLRSALIDLRLTAEKFKNSLPEYTASKEYLAFHASRYENKKEDPIFFF